MVDDKQKQKDRPIFLKGGASILTIVVIGAVIFAGRTLGTPPADSDRDFLIGIGTLGLVVLWLLMMFAPNPFSKVYSVYLGTFAAEIKFSGLLYRVHAEEVNDAIQSELSRWVVSRSGYQHAKTTSPELEDIPKKIEVRGGEKVKAKIVSVHFEDSTVGTPSIVLGE